MRTRIGDRRHLTWPARSGAMRSRQAQLTAADRAAYDCFGYSVAISGDTAVVGVHRDDIGANAEQGLAYVFLVAKPGKPTPISPKGFVSSRTPTIKWRAVAGAASCEVRISRGSKLLKQKTAITKTSWRCTTRLPRKVWLTWKVRA
ncbi:MAG TPA: FG-GAP repeat protein [Thermoleophilia bacterium]|nr:FG-GAP repeat protein [Thermoleophilia bacterium]